jgi:hypothetical protein
MPSYRDRWWCNLETCEKFGTCDRALTEEVKTQAIKYCGEHVMYSVRCSPECFVEGVTDVEEGNRS